jgi:hypothetical protein
VRANRYRAWRRPRDESYAYFEDRALICRVSELLTHALQMRALPGDRTDFHGHSVLE